MAQTATTQTVSEVVYNELLKDYCSEEFPPSARLVEKIAAKIESSTPGSEEAAKDAAQVVNMIWTVWDGGGMATLATKDIYATLGRSEDTKELFDN